jgi:hypothetical protein
MNACVIMHNMIIKSEHGALVVDDRPYKHQGPLCQVGHEMSAESEAFIVVIKKFVTPHFL